MDFVLCSDAPTQVVMIRCAASNRSVIALTWTGNRVHLYITHQHGQYRSKQRSRFINAHNLGCQLSRNPNTTRS